jgi:hypothetical protein
MNKEAIGRCDRVKVDAELLWRSHRFLGTAVPRLWGSVQDLMPARSAVDGLRVLQFVQSIYASCREREIHVPLKA